MGLRGFKMRSRIFTFKVRFSLFGKLEIIAKSPEEAEDIIRNMSDHEIGHLTEYSFENIEIISEPELIN